MLTPIKKYFENIPMMLTGTVSMEEPNEIITIFEGQFDLKCNDVVVIVKGRIFFSWLPSPSVKFEGDIVNATADSLMAMPVSQFEVFLGSQKLSTAYIRHFSVSDSDEVNPIAGTINPQIILGNHASNINQLKFVVPNLRSLWGESVRTGTSIARNRLIFETSDFKIVIDKLTSHNELEQKLQQHGGFIVTYNGQITTHNNKLQSTELRVVMKAFSRFLAFVNGRRCAPLFMQGLCDGTSAWMDYTPYLTDPYKSVSSWAPPLSNDGFNTLWQEFYRRWNIEDDRDVLNSAIHWYVEANNNSGFAEGSIIMIQTALELLYNWHLIEGKGLVKGRDAEVLSASNKIKLLLSDLSISSDFPPSCKTLRNIGADDAPEAFVRIRNAIVHSQEDKRKKLKEIPSMAIVEAVQLGIWYVELALLKILKYHGKYQLRTSGEEHSVVIDINQSVN